MKRTKNAGAIGVSWALLGWAVVALSACTAELGGSQDGSPTDSDDWGLGPDAHDEPLPPYAPHEGMLRRLTRAQFRNAMFDLFGVEIQVTELDSDGYTGDFAVTGAATVVTSNRGAEQYQEMAENVVDEIFADDARRLALMGCTPTSADDECTRGYLEKLGRRAWRRPLSSEELTRLLSVSSLAGEELGVPSEGARWATVALLGSPHFIYRPELGEPVGDGTNRLTSYELASRLAFLLWNSLPDDALLDEAESGVLTTSEGLLDVAEKLLAAPRGREAVASFAEDYMRLDRIAAQPKDVGLYPAYGPALQKAMVVDMREAWAKVAYDEDTSVLGVFSTEVVVANAELASLYGLDASGLTSDTYGTFTLPSDGGRTGALTRAGFLSQFANQKEGSPTLRGKFIREAIMCGEVPAPPANVALEIPESDSSAPTTKRERLADHRGVTTCAGCHALMDPLGLPLEQFDAIGTFRTTEHGLEIDPSGEFDGTPVDDARGLGEVLSDSETVAECIVRKYYQYALGYPERDVDEIVIQELNESFADSGRRLRKLILDVVAHEAFSIVVPQP